MVRPLIEIISRGGQSTQLNPASPSSIPIPGSCQIQPHVLAGVGGAQQTGGGAYIQRLLIPPTTRHILMFPSSNPVAAQSFDIWMGNENRDGGLIPKCKPPEAQRPGGAHTLEVGKEVLSPPLPPALHIVICDSHGKMRRERQGMT